VIPVIGVLKIVSDAAKLPSAFCCLALIIQRDIPGWMQRFIYKNTFPHIGKNKRTLSGQISAAAT
jgi:hypothetical protein